MELRHVLRKLMKDQNLTFKKLANLADVPESSLKDWASGAIPRDMKAVKRVAESLHVSFEFLILGSETSPPQTEESFLRNIPTRTLHSGWVKLSIEVPVTDSEQSLNGKKNKS